ncbi:hypothetical protein BTO30_10980 [Domibacillus antri]|uniref:Uncharacterized protein n=1 Tax=Domibacillus antri TaxID=1714264 RepID=A0A1Q8Q4I4_9BACI|nr:hypothetical protein [Domibacillus antri]OLN22264.1 hypothetical protein BTO30_10980 [Domibacillus antri]
MEEQNLHPEEEFLSSGNEYFEDAVEAQIPYFHPRPRLPFFPPFPLFPIYPSYPFPYYRPFPGYPFFPY